MSSKLSVSDANSILSARTAGVLEDLESKKVDFREGVIAVICPDGDQTEKRTHLEELVASQNGDKRVHLITQHGASLVIPWQSPLSNLSPFLYDFLVEVVQNRIARSFIYIFWPLWSLMGWLGRFDIQMIINIWKAIRMKGIKTIVLYIHAPCGAAGLCKISFAGELEHLILAKRRLKWWLGFMGIKVACFCHVDYGGGKKKTYFIKTHKAEKWLNEGGDFW